MVRDRILLVTKARHVMQSKLSADNKKISANFLLQSCEIKFAAYCPHFYVLAREKIFSLCVLKLQIQASECLEIIPDTWSLGPGVWKFSHCLLEGK